ncbi:hypothetical protein PG994_001021 [Apiospora phragmitis]|uniref:Uncharacterized protein n=1 Tax=Apiospora phragmitis TaxID=2905665 RepID=A0ABR1WRR7_9PEZI
MLRPRFASAVIGQEQANNVETVDDPKEEALQKNKSMLIFGVFTAARGAAILSSGFVTIALVHEDSTDLAGYGTGTKWRSLMIYTGAAMCAAAFGVFGKLISPSLKIGKSIS